MSTHKHFDRICVVVLLFSILLTILFMNGEALGMQVIVDEDAEAHSDSEWFTTNDLDGEWNTEGATTITLNGSDVNIAGNGAYAYDGGVVISNAGTYVLSGTLDDGSIVVNAHASSKVWLLLDNVTVSCEDNACLIVQEADKVFLTLAEGSENSFESGSTYTDEALEDGSDGVIFAHDDLTINGSGSLSVSGGWKHGIAANDDLVITGGKLTIEAAADGINVNDTMRICEADISITAGDDGIHSDTSFTITSGTLSVTECYEGIEAPTIEIVGGKTELYPSDDGLNANGGSSSFDMMGGMQPGGEAGGGVRPGEEADVGSVQSSDDGENGDNTENPEDDTETWVHISGGTLTILNDNARDADGIDSNGDILITGGIIRVSLNDSGSNNALDYGSENGGTCIITGGDIVACGSSAMAEGFETESSQCSILYNMENGKEAGTTVTVEDADGKELISYEVPCAFSSVNLSCPELKPGETCRLIVGDTEEEITFDKTAVSYGNTASAMPGGNRNRDGGQDGVLFGEHGMNGGRAEEKLEASGAGSSDDDSNTAAEGMRPDIERNPPDGEMPFKGEMPFEGRMPAGGEMPVGGRKMQPGVENRQPGESSETAGQDTAEDAGYSTNTRITFRICILVMAAGIVFAAVYRRRR